MHFLDLPLLRAEPSYESLNHTLTELSLAEKVDFEGAEQLDKGTRQWLASLSVSELAWIDNESLAEDLRSKAAKRLSQECGVTATSARQRKVDIGSGMSVALDEPGMTEDMLGKLTWGSSLMLAKRLAREPQLVKQLAVLELGAGTGLAGIAAKLVGAHTVHVTDLPEIVPNLANNVAKNNVECSSYALDWCKPQFPFADPPHIDVCLISDPVYSKEHPAFLLNAVRLVNADTVLLQLPLRKGFEAEREHIWDGLPLQGYKKGYSEEETGRDLFGEQTFSFTFWNRDV